MSVSKMDSSLRSYRRDIPCPLTIFCWLEARFHPHPKGGDYTRAPLIDWSP